MRFVTVLVVDDDPAIRLVCRVNLELDGFEVLEAATGRAAIELLAQHPVDVVVLDLRLEDDLDGVALAGLLRAGLPDVAIVGMTGVVPLDESFGALVDGAVTKPFDVRELLELVERLGAPAAVVVPALPV